MDIISVIQDTPHSFQLIFETRHEATRRITGLYDEFGQTNNLTIRKKTLMLTVHLLFVVSKKYRKPKNEHDENDYLRRTPIHVNPCE